MSCAAVQADLRPPSWPAPEPSLPGSRASDGHAPLTLVCVFTSVWPSNGLLVAVQKGLQLPPQGGAGGGGVTWRRCRDVCQPRAPASCMEACTPWVGCLLWEVISLCDWP